MKSQGLPMQEMMEVRLKDEIVHVNNDWMEGNVCTEKAFNSSFRGKTWNKKIFVSLDFGI